MCLYFNFWGMEIPSYGCMIGIGIVLSNIIAWILVKKNKHDWNDFLILEAYVFLGAFFGAKLLYLIVSYKEIMWNRMGEIEYFNQLMQGGFVFYGGLIGGLLLMVLAGGMHKINIYIYIREYIFLIPFIHCFGRIGCHLAGCCYGIPYTGIFSVKYPKGSFAPEGMPLFPIQITEAILLMIIAIIILTLQIVKKWKFSIEIYLISYGVLRFVLEFFRYDEERGFFMRLSTSQWISIGLIVFAIGQLVYFWKKNMDNCENVKN